ncbi:hypothetical protein [Alteribacter aurantiacus]|uniref:hypothetical protein n=1 Tax=Alteribacter aurantiacus TaxID=254410 RepID=UPI0003F6CFCF|nr:hypothetical protein [Alteribacter aurantiacus]
MVNIYLSSHSSIIHVSGEKDEWTINDLDLEKGEIQSLAVDPFSGVIYAGTFDHGLYRSENGGESFERIGEDILHDRVTSLHVAPLKDGGTYGTLYVGMEPSELFQSADGGETWKQLPALTELPSKKEWSFPPRPETHHVKDITTSYQDHGLLLAGIELGGVMRSLGNGETFEDRKEGSQFDVHNIVTHPIEEQYIYEAGGGGFAYSEDMGEGWKTDNTGLGAFTYLVQTAVDPADSKAVIVAGAKGPGSAYVPDTAEYRLFRKRGNEAFEQVEEGLPEAEGTTVPHLLTHTGEPGVFYAVFNRGIYRSQDQGKTWQVLPLEWPPFLQKQPIVAACLKEI